MKAFGYVTAKDVGHAVALLGEHGARAKIWRAAPICWSNSSTPSMTPK